MTRSAPPLLGACARALLAVCAPLPGWPAARRAARRALPLPRPPCSRTQRTASCACQWMAIQGNRITEAISCADVADVCLRALHNPEARNKTFEVGGHGGN